MRRTLTATLLAAGLSMALLAAGPTAAAAPTVVEMRTLSYAPSTVTFTAPGRTVRWRNVTSPNRLHDAVSSLPDYFASPLLASGGESTFTFRRAGTFTYICTIHDVMLGRVEVAPVVAVESGPEGPRLRITLGTRPFALTDAYRSAVFLQGPGDVAPRWRRTVRAASISLPVDRPGAWTVMVRVRHRSTGTVSSDSPSVTVTVPG